MNNQKKRMVISACALGAIAILYFAFVYPWPVNEGVQGTIGGVQKYNAGQLSDKDVKLGGSENSTDPIATLEQKVSAMEGRLAPNLRTQVIEARLQYIEARLAVPPEARSASVGIEARLKEIEARCMEKSASIPVEARLAILEARLAAPPEARTAQTAEQRLNNIESRLAIPAESRLASTSIEARLMQAEARCMERSAGLPVESRLNYIEARLAPSPEARLVILEARLNNIESRLNIPPEARTVTPEARLNNIESRLAPSQDYRQMQ
ncbi:MAG: hypothetical protein AUI33_18225 [Ignavibacteria bacterium 13_1_40CM_2_61_4]|nr:MAG: hypothetical protein AUI33_18225 [Ignavibacteria bacterium 13_1_40CM_2_61_4]